MNVNILQVKNPYLSGLNKINQQSKATKPINENHKQLEITHNELQYFKKLFPENATQIEKYLTFNKSGRIIENAVTPQGTLLDGKV